MELAMSDEGDAGKPVGGIGTMLMQSDVCPACGKIHDSRLVRYLPAVGKFFGASTSGSQSLPATHPAARTARGRGRKPSSLPLSWPLPPTSETYP
jgi:hypothetical protein